MYMVRDTHFPGRFWESERLRMDENAQSNSNVQYISQFEFDLMFTYNNYPRERRMSMHLPSSIDIFRICGGILNGI